jgi:glucan 1,4-alpha-glucosidase
MATQSRVLRAADFVSTGSRWPLLELWVVAVLGLFCNPIAQAAAAPDGPGALSHFDLARKDCVGTAQNTSSKVWFTVANGVLSDVYYPTHDNTNVETLQYVITDGSTFTDIQTRDMTYIVQPLDQPALDCRIIATAKSGKYRITTDYLTDTANNTVVIRSRFEALVGRLSSYRLYVVYNPSINGNGGGGIGGGVGNGGGDFGTVDASSGHSVLVAFDPETTSQAVNRDYAVPVYSALDAAPHFLQVTNGFVGAASDPLVQLDAARTINNPYGEADNGNLVQAAQVDISHGGNFRLALGFGTVAADAVLAAEASLATAFPVLRASFVNGWGAYDAGLKTLPRHIRGVNSTQRRAIVNAYYLNANLLKAAEDKTFPGALQAAASSPWGQAIPADDPSNLYYGSYREIFARDLYQQWTGLMADGDLQTASDAVHFLFYRQQAPDGSMPRNSLANGRPAPDSFNVQLDECSFPIIMANQMGLTDTDLYLNHILPAANFIASHGPDYGVERWEEQGGYSPSTLAAQIAGLIAAADIADANHDPVDAAVWRGVADDWQRSVEGWTVTSNGPLASQPYFIRLSKTGDPNAAISYGVGNGGPTLDQRAVVDAGFLELVRLGVKSASDPAVTASLPVVDASLSVATPNGPGWHRYTGDGYGDVAIDGQPWATTGQGTGHLWPVLSGERAEFALASGDYASALSLLMAMGGAGAGTGLIPEQTWEFADLAASPFGTDPAVASIGFRFGLAAGSSAPLNWAAGQYVRLVQDIANNELVDRPSDTFERYVAHQQAQTSLTVSAPANVSAVSGSPVTVTGTSAPGNTVYLSATNTDQNSLTSTATTLVDASGSFSIPVPVTSGSTVINTVAVSPQGATAHDQRSVDFDFTPGTVLLDATDPEGDDNGPGNYAYPTAGDFHAGAFDITDFKVILSPDQSTVTFKLQVRDLSPTFGSPLGAQLVDVYVRNPAAAAGDTSTAAAFPQRNYSIAANSAWSRLIEVQGFGQSYIDAHGNSAGSIAISANPISRFINFSVPTSSLGGTPGSGWGFTVVLTGQDGFSPDQARAFASTPAPYSLGVCAAASSDPHCTVDPGTVAKAMDVLTPSGVSQAVELDYTLGPVTIQGVFIP